MIELKGERLAQPLIQGPQRPEPYRAYVNRDVKTCMPLRLGNNEWAFAYSKRDAGLVDQIIESFRRGARGLGMSFEGEPIWIEVPDDSVLRNEGCSNTRDGNNFLFCMKNELHGRKVKICMVLIGNDRHHPVIKAGLD